MYFLRLLKVAILHSNVARVARFPPTITFLLLINVSRGDVEVGGAVNDGPEGALHPSGPGGQPLPHRGLEVGLVQL